MWALRAICVLAAALCVASALRNDTTSSCYDHLHRPTRCLPEFENAAFQLSGEDLEATNTCGEDGIPSDFCVQTGAKQFESCQRCIWGMYPPSHMTDINIMDNLTWWQSSTMLEGVGEVNITLHLRKAFDITYIRIEFYSPRPESFAIYKRTRENGEWEPYQFYRYCRII
ncbi:laminin subunit gamma-1-like [Halyomorpha halys]|uniref:laminin subunit gamma-1-like n=1 Tax=Halyomorpha halys TaxID=286706 RepID=UPI0034D29EBE